MIPQFWRFRRLFLLIPAYPLEKAEKAKLQFPDAWLNVDRGDRAVRHTRRVWYRTLAGIWRICFGCASPKVVATPSSAATRFPHETVEMIIAHLIYDNCSLLACSRTCYSWYIAVVPHPHHTLTIIIYTLQVIRSLQWPFKYRLGLLPLVRGLRTLMGFADDPDGFPSNRLNPFLLPRAMH